MKITKHDVAEQRWQDKYKRIDEMSEKEMDELLIERILINTKADGVGITEKEIREMYEE